MKKIFFIAFLILLSSFFTYPVLAEDPIVGDAPEISIKAGEIDQQLKAVAGEQGADFGKAEDPRMVVVNIIKVALSGLGILFLVYIFYAGFRWMTAGGDEEKIKSAQKTIKYAVIGTLIVLSSYSIALFVQKKIYEAQSLEPSKGGWFFEVEFGVEEEMTQYYPDQDPMGGSAFVPGYESVWGPSGATNYEKKF